MSAVLAIANPHRIKRSHRRRGKVASGRFVQRYYDPICGCFISADPVQTDPNTGGSFNRYNYANNNPFRFTDPDGRSALTMAIKFILKGGDAAATFAGVIDDANTVMDSNASTGDRVLAGISILSEAAPISLRDGKAVAKMAEGAGNSKPLLGRNDTSGPKSSRHTTDLGPNGNRASAKSIFRNQAEGKKITTPTADGGTRTRADNNVQIRHKPDGRSSVDLPGRGTKPNGETIHTPKPKPDLKF